MILILWKIVEYNFIELKFIYEILLIYSTTTKKFIYKISTIFLLKRLLTKALPFPQKKKNNNNNNMPPLLIIWSNLMTTNVAKFLHRPRLFISYWSIVRARTISFAQWWQNTFYKQFFMELWYSYLITFILFSLFTKI